MLNDIRTTKTFLIVPDNDLDNRVEVTCSSLEKAIESARSFFLHPCTITFKQATEILVHLDEKGIPSENK